MNIFCRIFGHTPELSLEGGYFYRIGSPYHDGIGRSHRNLYSTCNRCGVDFKVGKTIDQKTKERRRKT